MNRSKIKYSLPHSNIYLCDTISKIVFVNTGTLLFLEKSMTYISVGAYKSNTETKIFGLYNMKINIVLS